MQPRRKATLTLEDGSCFHGYTFGYDEEATTGEVVFNTAMNGYNESLSDPSYAHQIMVMTYPHVGNYGVPPRDKDSNGLSKFLESEHIHMHAIVVSDYSYAYSHWNAVQSLDSWLKEEKVMGLTGIDTRALTKILRERGSMKGVIVPEGVKDVPAFKDYNKINIVAEKSPKEVLTYGNGKKKVVLVDCGAKLNIVRNLITPDTTLIRVPWDYDFTKIDYDGLFISNGPGDPTMCHETIHHLREAFNIGKPIAGICLGNQLMALASGAKIFKLKYGHRSHNQPVRRVGTNSCFITSQNHSFCVDSSTLSDEWNELYVNLNDGTNEGLIHKEKPFFSVQFHPEACGGPTDTLFIFDEFLRSIK